MKQLRAFQFNLFYFLLTGLFVSIVLYIFLLIPTYYREFRKPKKNTPFQIKFTLKQLTAALREYKNDWKKFPPHTPLIFDSQPLVIYLDGNPDNGGPKKRYFFKYQNNGNKLNVAQNLLLDYKSQTYHYRLPKNSDGSLVLSIQNKNFFDLWSEGEVGRLKGDPFGKDDITNWSYALNPNEDSEALFFMLILFAILCTFIPFHICQTYLLNSPKKGSI